MSKIPNLVLNNGITIPVLGLGTWQGPPGQEHEVKQAVLDAIDLGYRHFDCAHVYLNESLIGEAIQQKIKEGVVKREDLFITSKLWNTYHSPNLVEPALRTTLKNLQLDYLDLYLVHWPFGLQEGGELRPTTPEGLYLFSDVDYVDTWKAMEEVYKLGLVRAIGVSNFNSLQLTRLLKNCTVVPAINQIECHPYLNQVKLREFCENKGIKITSYSPLGSPSRPWAKPGDPDVINDENIKKIAQKYNKSPAQILIKYNIQLGNSVVPKSSNPKRLKENMNIFDFTLAAEDIAQIKQFECNGRICTFLGGEHGVEYPFKPDIEF